MKEKHVREVREPEGGLEVRREVGEISSKAE